MPEPPETPWYGSAWTGQPAPTIADVTRAANELAARRRQGERVTLDQDIEVATLLVRALTEVVRRGQDPKAGTSLAGAKARLLELERAADRPGANTWAARRGLGPARD